MRPPSRQSGPFPIDRAFVVQLRDDTALDAEHLTGRVEHLLTGQNTQFESLAMLQAFVASVLKADEPSPDC